VLVAVEAKEDVARIVQWLKDHPFKDMVELCILSVVVPVAVDDPYLITQRDSWLAAAKSAAEDLVENAAAELAPAYRVSTRVATGDAASTVAAEAQGMDLIVVSTHGRRGLERLLLGSVCHSIVHSVSGPILIIH
jgi:nucleotide-binding universal stress UspA family protein